MPQTVADTIEFVGTLQPTLTVELRSQVKGYLEKILFADGAKVKAGQELFVLEQEPYQLALESAKAAKQKAQASLTLAEKVYARNAPLVANGVVTQEELDVQAAQVATAKADLASAEAAVRNAEHDLSYTHIKAPIDGRIGRHMVDVGTLVQAQQTSLATIQRLDPIYGEFHVSENDLLRFMDMLRNNELSDPDRNPPELRLERANEKGFPHKGRLDYRERSVNQPTGTAMRRAIFPNPNWELLPGMFVRIQGQIGEPKPHLLVEDRAIQTDQRGDYLLVVNDENVVDYRAVKPGFHVGTLRVIDEGITAKDRVVVNGLQRARPGAKVKPESAETPTTAPKSTATASNENKSPSTVSNSATKK